MTVSKLTRASCDLPSSPDPGESSNAGRMPSVVQPRHHIPYLDHNYGQPPPMTPPDSCSPIPEDVDTGNEEEGDSGITRCICGYNHDDGYMICCDKCSVWQHIECMGISSKAVPDNYLCEQCDPRPLNKELAKAIQSRKRQEMSDDDEDDDDSEEEGQNTTYTAVSNTPTRITLTAKVSRQKRKRTVGKNKVDKEKDKMNKRRKHPKQRSPNFLPVDEDTNMAWDNNYAYEDYEEAVENIYSKELEDLVLSVKDDSTNGVSVPEGNVQFCEVVDVQRNNKGLVTTEDLNKNQFLIKCKGRMMLGSNFEKENQFFKRYSPHVLFYDKLDHLCLCVDARTFGNDARFVRRSCSPNAEVRHFFSNGKLCLALFSLCPLPKGAEITIPFEHSLHEYKSHLTCACSQDTCAVVKFNLRCQQPNHNSQDKLHQQFSAPLPTADDSSNSGHHHHNKMSPLRMALPGHNSFHGDSDSDIENNPDRSLEGESQHKKLSREERKLEALVKQIEKMEKKEKKRQQPTKDHRLITRTPSEEGKILQRSIGPKISKRMNHKRRSNGGSAMKKKRPRMSSCSSEPHSADEASSSASTPTTPKTVSTIPEEATSVTPSTSPSRNFRFPKTKMKDDSHGHPLKLIIKTEGGESNATSCLSSPCSPRESETETKPTPSIASSNSDIAMDEEADGGMVDEMGGSSMDDHRFMSLAGRLAEFSSVASSESNTPSPCPSTSASPTCSESVMNGYPPLVSSGRSPGPAPGSPLSAVLHGPQASRSSPLYCSLKKRWLCQFLYGYNMPENKPPNGLKQRVPVSPISGSKSSTRTIKEPLPLKKRHLKTFQDTPVTDMCSTTSSLASTISFSTAPTVNHVSNRPSDCPSSELLSSPPNISTLVITAPSVITSVALPEEKQSLVHDLTPSEHQTNLAVSVCEPGNYSQSLLGTYSRQLDTRTDQIHVDAKPELRTPLVTADISPEQPSPRSELEKRAISDYQPLTINASYHRRPSEPRIVSPAGSSLASPTSIATSVITGVTGLHPVTVSHHQPLSVITSLVSASVSSTTDMQNSTPGKKKVSLLEYRKRSQQRLSGDSPRSTTAPSVVNSSLSPSSTPSSTPLKGTSSSPLQNMSTSNVDSHTGVSQISTAGGVSSTNGPCLEPVSPDDDDSHSNGSFRSSSSLTATSTLLTGSPKFGSLATVDPVLRKQLVQKNKEMLTRKQEGISKFSKQLSAIISEQLQKDANSSPGSNSTRSPSTGSHSPSVPPPPPPPPEQPGDAMDIEDEEGQPSGSKILVNTPIAPTRLALPQQPMNHVSDYAQVHSQQPPPDYHLALHQQHHHHPHSQPSLLAPLITVPGQLPTPSQPQGTRISQPTYLMPPNQGVPSHVAYPPSYARKPPSQGASYYKQ
ncbi:inactive histone-lysine N-methyltransferase 2E isoform X2 [Nematostella vectensis]|uniref:inactive histone-lysine N-methyltransferase 2E isoform X2 n=1 Tax=Nematostella vectensis TaxID=45351 RepID=UPI002076E9FD|nr:inactive histone-lysine N-methyltransferase 2E isoform X2 [Nematostella vectensis]